MSLYDIAKVMGLPCEALVPQIKSGKKETVKVKYSKSCNNEQCVYKPFCEKNGYHCIQIKNKQPEVTK